MLALGFPVLSLSILFLDGLTLVCLVGTVLLFVVFRAFRATCKVRNILADPHVSLTVTIPKRIPFCPWIKIPSATITFQGQASIASLQETPEEIQRALMEDLKMSSEARSTMCFIKVRPEGRFLTYGVGTSLRGMLNPEQAIAHTPV